MDHQLSRIITTKKELIFEEFYAAIDASKGRTRRTEPLFWSPTPGINWTSFLLDQTLGFTSHNGNAFLISSCSGQFSGTNNPGFSSSCRPSIVSRFNFVDIQNLPKFIYGPHSKKRFSATLTSSQREKQNRLSDFFVLNANEFLPLKTRLIDFFFRLLNVAIWSSLRMHSH